MQYIDYVQICRLFIRAARTVDSELHVFATSKMLNLFVATCHVHIANRSRIYLDDD